MCAESSRHCHAIAMPLPCHCHAIAMPLPCHCHAIVMPLPCHCNTFAMSLPCNPPCYCLATAVLVPRRPASCHAVARQLPCCCHAVVMPSPGRCCSRRRVSPVPRRSETAAPRRMAQLQGPGRRLCRGGGGEGGRGRAGGRPWGRRPQRRMEPMAWPSRRLSGRDQRGSGGPVVSLPRGLARRARTPRPPPREAPQAGPARSQGASTGASSPRARRQRRLREQSEASTP